MPADSYWECIRRECEILSVRNSSLRPRPPGVFEPGDFAYHAASLHNVFNEYLERKGYQLRPAEQRVLHSLGRYCIVLRRLGADKYVVCYLATFGGARDFRDIKDPMGQYFGLPLGGKTFWPGVTPLRTMPPWRPSNGGGFILGIPVARDGLRRANLSSRFRLNLSDVQRLITLIRKRDQNFEQHVEEIRRKHINWMLTTSATPLTLKTHELPTQQSISEFSSDHKQPRSARWLTLPTQQHNLSWVLQHLEHDIMSRSIYLNTLTLKRPKPVNLPKPFFASSLRASVTTIARFLR